MLGINCIVIDFGDNIPCLQASLIGWTTGNNRLTAEDLGRWDIGALI